MPGPQFLSTGRLRGLSGGPLGAGSPERRRTTALCRRPPHPPEEVKFATKPWPGREVKVGCRKQGAGGRAGVCLKGRALWGQTQGGYKAVGARCKIGWGAVTGGWNRVGVALGLQTCLRVELKEEPWGGGGGGTPSLQAKPWGRGATDQAYA